MLLEDYTVRTILAGTVLLGAMSGAVGSFAMLRQRSLIGDAISHATLPGLCIAFLVTGSKSYGPMLLGAMLAGWLAMLVMTLVTRTSRIKEDSALGIVLSVFFGAGLVLLTMIQKMPNANQAGMDKFLFGQAAALVAADVRLVALAAACIAVLLLLAWKELKLFAFDTGFTESIGYRTTWLDYGLITALVVVIVLGLQAVGVVLMSALVVAPAAAARQWTDRLGVMVVLAALIGALASAAGTLWSATVPRIPTGPAIVLSVGVFVAVSLLFAPQRGIWWASLRNRARRRRLRLFHVLLDMYELARQHSDKTHAHRQEVLHAMARIDTDVEKTLQALAREGLVQCVDRSSKAWALTESGVHEAEQLWISMHPEPMPDPTP